MRHALALFLGIGLALAGVRLTAQVTQRFEDADFARKVAPLLKQHCLRCHNTQKARGGLDLSRRAGLIEGGEEGAAILPGHADKSLLLRMVQGPKPSMPRQADPLSAAEIDLLRRWVDAGAPWPDVALQPASQSKGEPWWAVQELRRPELPKVKDEGWCRTPIDAFILSTLEAKGLTPGAEADRVTFIRRATYDLHGLPPTPEEINAFVSDRAPDAFEKLIDRLLASPRYGERWGRHWLDLVHYADTHGFDKDKRRLWAWLFRDWVIRALNSDMPYRRFARAQLAGDILYADDPAGIIATGFVVAGPWDFVGQTELREGSVEKEKTRTLDRDDMVSNAITTFCSLTVGCARCHDHKFDPIPQHDYYRLQAVFAGVERGDRTVVTPDDRARQDVLAKRRAAAAAGLAALEASVLRSADLERLELEILTLQKELAALPAQGPAQASPSNGYHSGIESRAEVMKWVQVDLGASLPLDAVRLIPARPVDFPDTPGFGFPRRFQVALSDDADFARAEILLDYTRADYPNPGDRVVAVPAGGKRGRYVRVTARHLWKRTEDYVFALAEIQVLSGGRNIAAGARLSSLDSIEAGLWSRRYLVDGFDSRHRLPDLHDPGQQRRAELEARLAEVLDRKRQIRQRLLDEASPGVRQALSNTAAELQALDRVIRAEVSTKVYSVLPIPPRPIHVLARGDVERKGTLVRPGALRLLPSLERHFEQLADPGEGPRRVALAGWVTDDDNPLTWRSIVNRVWHWHMGRGLVDTPSDFGKNGSRPTHPELLDWLATEFRSEDSLKRLHRLIMLSATYRQSSAHRESHARLDADNRFLWRMNRQRLDAESIRDSVLAISGKLDLTMFGPGYELFRFKDDHSPVYDHLDPDRIHDPATYRRTVYRFVVRSVQNPFLESLDCADPNINVPVRNTTMTALQALALLNDPFMVRQAEYFAARVRARHADVDGQVAEAYRLALGRPALPEEAAALADYARRYGLANACRMLFNANAFVFVD